MSHRSQLTFALAGLALVHGVVLFAGFVAPCDPAQQNRTLPFAPPNSIHWNDNNGSFHLRPFTYAWKPIEGEFAAYREDTSRSYPLRLFVPDSNFNKDGTARRSHHLFGFGGSAQIFLLGSDGYGRDQFSRLLFGGRVSLLAGLLAASLSMMLGTLLGAIAGFYGGNTDEALMRAVELSMALPWLYLLFAVRALLPLQLSALQAFFVIAAVIGAVGWARPARVVRGVVLSAKERMYVLAARGFGATNWYLLRRHIVPQAASVVLTQAALLVPQYILGEVTLSFLGVGAGETTPSWGTMLGSIQYHVLTSYWWMALPAIALVPIFWGYHLLAVQLQHRFSSSD